MWSDIPHAQFAPESEEEFRIVYDTGGGLADEAAAADLEAAARGRGGRLRYTQADARAMQRRLPQQQSQHPQHPQVLQPVSPAHSGGGGQGQVGAGVQDAPPLTLAQELQGVLSGFDQPAERQAAAVSAASGDRQQQQQQQDQDDVDEPRPWRVHPRRSGVRRIAHTSPAVPPASQLPPLPGSGQPSGGRRWARAQAAAAAALRTSPAAAPSAAAAAAQEQGADAFFSVDPDLLQVHTSRQQAVATVPGRRAGQGRAASWNSPQAGPGAAPAGGAAEQTPVPASQRANPLAALLGSGAKPRAATTGGKARGRHPIYGHAGTPSASQPANPSQHGGFGGGGSAGGAAQLRERLGLRDAPLTSPRQAQQRRHGAQPQQHSRFAIRDAVPTAGGAGQPAEASAAAAGLPGAAAALHQLTGETPAPASRERSFQPRPQRPASPGEDIVEEEDEQAAATGPRQCHNWEPSSPAQQRAGPGLAVEQQGPGQPLGDGTEAAWAEMEREAAADGFRTPGQPLRRHWQGAEQQQQHLHGAGGAGPGAGPAPGSAAGAGGSVPPRTGGRGAATAASHGKSLQRQFVAQLQPVNSSVSAATMQQQRQRLAGAAGLHARMQAILAAEKAGLNVSPGAAGAGPRLTVLQKELEGSVSKCLCRCDSAAQQALGVPEVVALFQSRTAQRVDTAPGSVILLHPPWRVMPLAGSTAPAVLCFSASVG